MSTQAPNTARRFSPSHERFKSIHVARKRTPMLVVRPPESPGVEGMVDLHFHASEGYQNALLETAQFASRSGMRALLIKSYRQLKDPMTGQSVARVAAELADWAEREGVAPVALRAGYIVWHNPKGPHFDVLRQNLEDGVAAVWFPVANALRSWTIVGPQPDSEPLSREAALAKGAVSVIDDSGALRAEFKTYVDMIAEYDRLLCFGHRSHEELLAVARYATERGVRRMMVDHPFSPFIDLSLDQMRALAGYGVKFNFTYNEVSPFGGVDPQDVYNAIKEIGPEHFTISSDAGDAIFPNSVECMRLMRVMLQVYGLDSESLELVSSRNAAFLLGLTEAP